MLNNDSKQIHQTCQGKSVNGTNGRISSTNNKKNM